MAADRGSKRSAAASSGAVSPRSLTLALVPALSAPAAARRALQGLDGNLDEKLRERSELVLGEVVTNSVRHAGLTSSQQIGIQVSLSADVLRIEVTDAGPGFEHVPLASKPGRTPGGWGLWLVDQLTDRWGVDWTHGSRVWLEFDRAASGGPGQPSAA